MDVQCSKCEYCKKVNFDTGFEFHCTRMKFVIDSPITDLIECSKYKEEV